MFEVAPSPWHGTRRFVEFINSFDEWIELLQQCIDTLWATFPGMRHTGRMPYVFNGLLFSMLL